MRISDLSSDVCSSDLPPSTRGRTRARSAQIRHLMLGPLKGSEYLLVELYSRFQTVESRVKHASRRHVSIAARERSEERRVGHECVSTCRSRGSPDREKKKKNAKMYGEVISNKH